MSTDLLLYLGTISIWGSTWLVTKFQSGVVSPEVSVVYRFALASMILFIWCWIKKLNLRFSLQDHFFMMLQGLALFGLNYQLIYLASQSIPSGLNAVIFSSILIFDIINSTLFYHMAITGRTVLAALLGLVGVGTVFSTELSSLDYAHGPLFGYICSLGAAIITSFGHMVAVRHHRRSLPVTETNAFAMGYGAILTTILLLIRGIPFSFDVSAPYLTSLFYLSVFGSVFAFGCYLKLQGRIGPQRSAYAPAVTPIIALGISTLFENYIWTLQAIVGFILILLGNVLVLARKKSS